MTPRTKIVATIGPASASPEVLNDLFEAGVSVTRLGLAHGSIDNHLDLIRTIRKVAEEKQRYVAVLADLPGPKIRTTDMGDSGVVFTDLDSVELRSGKDRTTASCIYTDYATCAADLHVGDLIALGDGGVDLQVTAINGDVVTVTVLNGGQLRGRPGLHLPAERVTLPVPTDEDRELIEKVALAGEVDFVAVSFVRNAAEIERVRELLGDSGIRIVAKIETPSALDNLEEIVMVSDAVMVARGDLGTECPFEDVPVYQKQIIRTCLAHATPVITATQMMESMITASTPTRAEASDVANAVCDGTDAIMLSGETAIGHNPVLVVQAMAKIAKEAEIVADFDRIARMIGPERQVNEITAAITRGALYAMNDVQVKAILCCTRSGATAHAMAALRPDEAVLLALSTSETTVRQEALTWGVHPMALPPSTNSDAMVATAIKHAQMGGFVQQGDIVAVLSGGRDIAGSTDTLRLIAVGDERL